MRMNQGENRSLWGADIEKIFEFLMLAEKLKVVKRDNFKSDGEFESDADHSWMLALMAVLFEKKVKTKVDIGRVMKIIAVHDLAEAITGDVPLYKQGDGEEVKKAKDEAERAAMEKLREMLPGELGEEVFELWEEYEGRETAEARYVKALDKLEAITQSLAYEDISYWGDYGDGKFYYDNVLRDRRRGFWEHEGSFVEYAEKLKSVTREKMIEAGLDVAEYE